MCDRKIYSILTLILCVAASMVLSVSAVFPQNVAATNSMSLAPGYVSQQTALNEIKRHKALLTAKRTAIDARYDYFKVTETLKRVFAQNGVRGKGMEYASSWGPNSVYLTLTDLAPFYLYHFAQLSESERRISQPGVRSVKRSDLDYLEQGMKNWQLTEEKASAEMDQMANFFGQRAALLEQRIDAYRKTSEAPENQKAYLNRQVQIIDENANQKGRMAGAVRQRMKQIGATTRYFSAINAEVGAQIKPCRETKVNNPLVPTLNVVTMPKFAGGPL